MQVDKTGLLQNVPSFLVAMISNDTLSASYLEILCNCDYCIAVL